MESLSDYIAIAILFIMKLQFKAIIMKHHRKNSNFEFHSPVRTFILLDIVFKTDYGYKMDDLNWEIEFTKRFSNTRV